MQTEKPKREVFQSEEYCDVIEYRPNDPVLVQSDHRKFEIDIKPKDNVQTIAIKWTLYSRNYKKEGNLSINVNPKYEDKQEIIEVDKMSELKADEVVISPKIIEE